MVSEETPCHELLYYMSEKDAEADLAKAAYAVFHRRHFPNLLKSCHMSLGSLTKGQPIGGVSVEDAAMSLATEVMFEVFTGLCKKFTRAPKPGTEVTAVRAWLSRIASNFAHRHWIASIRESTGYPIRHRPSRADVQGDAEERDFEAELVEILMEADTDRNGSNHSDGAEDRAHWRSSLALLGEKYRDVLIRSVEFDAGWSLDGHATRASSKRLAEYFNSNPANIRQLRKRALQQLRSAYARLKNPENGSNEKATSSSSNSVIFGSTRRRN